VRIELTLKNYRCFPDTSPARIVIEDGTWTAFLGVNNAGKSSLLRFFFEFRPFFQLLSQPGQWHHVASDGQGVGFGGSVRDPKEVFHILNDRNLSIEIRVSTIAPYADKGGLFPSVVRFEFKRSNPQQVALTLVEFSSGDKFPIGPGVDMESGTLLARSGVRADIAVYVDVMKRLSRTFYVGAFRNVLNKGAKEDYFDIQVGDAFIRRWRGMQSGNDLSANAACEEVVAAIEHLFGYGRLTIQAADSNDTLQLTIDRRPYKLHEVGSGLAQFILVLVNVAVARPAYVLIDEPELNLHPSLQLDFLASLTAFADFGVLFSTHSIGLARSAADRIYTVRRLQQGVSEVVPYEATPNLAEFLGALNYSSYHALGFTKVLLVEGPTEVRAVQQFLRKIGRDHHILVMQLGGASMINGRRELELSELKRITPDLFALVDSEKPSPTAALQPDREDFKRICQGVGIDCHILERRAFENYLAEPAIQRVKGNHYRQLGHYDLLKDANPKWNKNENWRIASEMTWDDIKDTDLGKFLEQL
jgi:ABC-type Na+ transport system ATPase subunit NatA